mmetsp:Transcript_44369/g.117238  ORF Transcript_44369/g.117238 Transcript_44369/m.117238 type:complete len:357 (-) Transcript_44369:731-1801(-)
MVSSFFASVRFTRASKLPTISPSLFLRSLYCVSSRPSLLHQRALQSFNFCLQRRCFLFVPLLVRSHLCQTPLLSCLHLLFEGGHLMLQSLLRPLVVSEPIPLLLGLLGQARAVLASRVPLRLRGHEPPLQVLLFTACSPQLLGMVLLQRLQLGACLRLQPRLRLHVLRAQPLHHLLNLGVPRLGKLLFDRSHSVVRLLLQLLHNGVLPLLLLQIFLTSERSQLAAMTTSHLLDTTLHLRNFLGSGVRRLLACLGYLLLHLAQHVPHVLLTPALLALDLHGLLSAFFPQLLVESFALLAQALASALPLPIDGTLVIRQQLLLHVADLALVGSFQLCALVVQHLLRPRLLLLPFHLVL